MRAAVTAALFLVLSLSHAAGAESRAAPNSIPPAFRSIDVQPVADATGGTIARPIRDGITQSLAARLRETGFTLATARNQADATLETSVISCQQSAANGPGAVAPKCFATATVTERRSGHVAAKFVVSTPALLTTAAEAAAAGRAIGDEVSAELDPAVNTSALPAGEDVTAPGGAQVAYYGNGIFVVRPSKGQGGNETASVIDLKHIRHAYDPAIDKDVPTYTNVTLNDVVPRLVDEKGQEYAQITLYQIDPPLVAQPSKEAGVNRGTDFRDPSNLVKGAYTNYVSPVFSNDREKRRVPSHPIGHFYVKVEIPGYPTVLTGMTTIARADTELMEYTIRHELGIGGVLLTPEPGRLNSATEPFEELSTRQRELRIVDGLYFRSFLGRNRGPEYVVSNGNVVFARFKVPVKNAKDAMAFFVEYIARGEHNIFGSLLNRPNRGTGAGCTPFAISWLEAAGIIPFAAEPPELALTTEQPPLESAGATDFWLYLHRTIYIPWGQIGCDDRLGVDHVVPAQYTIYDLLFHDLPPETLRSATQGLAGKIKRDYGFVAGTLFQFGAQTPIRDLIINAKRKDPRDVGDYGWGKPGEGLLTSFWDDGLFSAWVKSVRERATDAGTIVAAQDGRLYGIVFDAMTAPRQAQPFFAEADRIIEKKRQLAQSGAKASSCEEAFRLDLQ